MHSPLKPVLPICYTRKGWSYLLYLKWCMKTSLRNVARKTLSLRPSLSPQPCYDLRWFFRNYHLRFTKFRVSFTPLLPISNVQIETLETSCEFLTWSSVYHRWLMQKEILSRSYTCSCSLYLLIWNDVSSFTNYDRSQSLLRPKSIQHPISERTKPFSCHVIGMTLRVQGVIA